ncbi:MAG: hypothetical protein R3F05_18600 [Planctomycetota bacterium]
MPAESATSGGMDFRCRTDGFEFLVDAKVITMQAAAEATGIAVYDFEGGSHSAFTMRLAEQIEKSHVQAARAAGDPETGHLPCVLWLGTLHPIVAAVGVDEWTSRELLTGETSMTWPVRDGAAIGPMRTSTDLHGTPFLVYDPLGGMSPKNRSISAVLLVGPGVWTDRSFAIDPPVCGILHPAPLVAFPGSWALPGVPFLRLAPGWRHRTLRVRRARVRREPHHAARHHALRRGKPTEHDRGSRD